VRETHCLRPLPATGLINHYQPIVDLQSGTVVGVETLARLASGKAMLPPTVFLPELDAAGLENLFFAQMRDGLATLGLCRHLHTAFTISFNISPFVLQRPHFRDRLLAALAPSGTEPERITLEILETDEFLSLPAARRLLAELREAGIGIALDDVGAGYSSLARFRELVAPVIKLDQAFVRELHRQPDSLHFVAAMLSLARGLRCSLVVEGVETAETMEALAMLGVSLAQGYAIARPMPQVALLEWLARHVQTPASREPRSLLGAYAAHITMVEAFHALRDQPLEYSWPESSRDPRGCAIGRFLHRAGLQDTPHGRAHRNFRRVINRHREDPAAWHEASQLLSRRLHDAIIQESGRRSRSPSRRRARRCAAVATQTA